jgi:hypothetical protein
VLIGVQASVAGWYTAPSPTTSYAFPYPPQTIIALPVQTATCPERGDGAPTLDMGLHESVAGSYRKPESILTSLVFPSAPPQTIISLPVHTAV